MAIPTPQPTDPRRSTTVRRVALAGGAAVGLLAVAAVAAGGDGGDSGGITLPAVRWLVAAVFVVLLLIGVAAFVALLVQPRERRPRSTVSQLRVLLVAAGIVVVLLLLVGRRSTGAADVIEDGGPEGETGQPAAQLTSDTAARDVALLLGLVVIGATVAVVAAGKRVDPDAVADDEVERRAAAALSDVLDEAVAALRAEPDPRRAVIAAYAHVERSLGFHRLPRRPSETALEYLARLLEHLDASGPAIRRLTGLFELAMFSARPVDRAMQDEAVDALVAVRDELRALAAGDRA